MIDTQLIENNSGDARRIRELLCEAMWTPVNLAVADRLSIGPEHLDAHRKNLIPLDLERPQSYRILAASSWAVASFT